MDAVIKWLGFGLQCLSVLIVPLLKFWLDEFKKADRENAREIKGVRTELHEFKKDVSDNYVKRDEFLELSGKLLAKSDEITKVVYEIKGEIKNRKY